MVLMSGMSAMRMDEGNVGWLIDFRSHCSSREQSLGRSCASSGRLLMGAELSFGALKGGSAMWLDGKASHPILE